MATNDDYYKILGLTREAGEGEIKKAYRKLALKYHPDKTEGDKTAEEKFKKITEAYAVLSDREKRQNYDMYGHSGFQQQYSREDIFRNFDTNSIFHEFGFGDSDIFSNLSGGGARGTRGGFSSSAGEDMFSGFGQQARARRTPRRGDNIQYDLHVSFKESVFGAERLVAFNVEVGVAKISVKVPPGIEHGKKLRLAGKGHPSPNGGPPGDLFVKIIVEPHPDIMREGNDLAQKIEILPSEAILGKTVTLETLDEKNLSLRIPPGTQSHTRLRVKNHGIPLAGGKSRGDLFVRVVVNYPDTLTDRQKELLEALSEEGL